MFDWDGKKAEQNVRKHGISFEEAVTCFDDSRVCMRHDVSHSIAEDRYMVIARSSLGKILTMIFTVRRDLNEKKNYRIISARLASKKERKAYS